MRTDQSLIKSYWSTFSSTEPSASSSISGASFDSTLGFQPFFHIDVPVGHPVSALDQKVERHSDWALNERITEEQRRDACQCGFGLCPLFHNETWLGWSNSFSQGFTSFSKAYAQSAFTSLNALTWAYSRHCDELDASRFMPTRSL